MASTNQPVCPKCGHLRSNSAKAPDWQCPACGIAYAKYASYLQKKGLVGRRPANTDVLADWSGDGSLWSLIAANLLTLLMAVAYDWTLSSILFVYWGQSVIIGIANAVRIVSLRDFSTEGFKVNGERPPEIPKTKWTTGLFFLCHYGFFHLVYVIFLVAEAEQQGGYDVLSLGFGLLMVAFAVNHFFSLRYNMEVDRSGKPNIGTLMFTPYLRIVPMHLIIIFGSTMESTTTVLLLFVGLKTVADAGMHMVEHAYLSGKGRVVSPQDGV